MSGTSFKLKTYAGKWGKPQLLHLLRRGLFGVSHGDLKAFEGKDMDQCVEHLLTSSSSPPPPINNYNHPGFTDPSVPLGETWVNAPGRLMSGSTDVFRQHTLRAWWVGQLVNQDHSITEKMTLFWHNHFATEMKVVKDARYSYRHIALLRSNALGNFKKLVREVTVDPNMLVYLNGNVSSKIAPNENYGRELQELFVLGKGEDSHYSEDDVKAASRLLTGWRDNKELATAYFEENDHDETDKKFSAYYDNAVIKGRAGKEGAKETDELIDLIFTRKAASAFLCRKLYRWFVHNDINEKVEQEVIAPLAGILVRSNFEVKPVLRALFTSQYFYSPNIIGGMIKSPMDFEMGFFKQFKVTLPNNNDYQRMLYMAWFDMGSFAGTELHQDIGDPPSVAGWPAYYQAPSYYKIWLNAETILSRTTLTDGLSSKEGVPIEREWISGKIFSVKFDFIRYISEYSAPQDAEQLVKDSITLLCPLDIGPFKTAQLRSFLAPANADGLQWPELWKQFKNEPSKAELLEEVETRLRKMFSALMKAPEYQMT